MVRLFGNPSLEDLRLQHESPAVHIWHYDRLPAAFRRCAPRWLEERILRDALWPGDRPFEQRGKPVFANAVAAPKVPGGRAAARRRQGPEAVVGRRRGLRAAVRRSAWPRLSGQPTAGQPTRGRLDGQLLDEARHLQHARVEVARVEVVGPQAPDHLVHLAQLGDREGLMKKRKRQARGLDELANPRHRVAQYLPVVESLYRVEDLSRAGALGLWQIMPQRARALDLKLNYWIDERKDPEKSTRAAARYLKELFLMLDDWHLVLAGYNRGEFGLVRDLKFSNATTICEMAERSAVPKETQLYVPQFIAVSMIGEDPQKYGYDLVYDPPLVYDTVKIPTVIDLKIVAQCAGTSLSTIRELNPSLIAWCTPHNAPDFELHIPSGTAGAFTANIALVKDLNPSPGYIKYKVLGNDWLEKIAKKFSTTVTAIKEDNARVKKQKYLRVGQVLIIRPGRKYKG